ncbi:hypothetical protein OPQ81_009774 [Rhizoctonia solani]|nr:hypothetical protein OPQ81_009774 [Rhizoctonia solani]
MARGIAAFIRGRQSSLRPPPLSHTDMKSYVVMFTESATKEEMENYKHRVQEMGGSIKYEYDLIKGMAVSMPDDHVQSFAADPIVSTMEADGIVTTQN